jgi:protein-L-isoaspartate(D-aspartate) O-methyltransferase
MVALMTQALELKGEEKVLEVGTGSGYQAAILAELSKHVYTVERVVELVERTRKLMDRLGYTNVDFKTYNGSLGWEEHAPYDGIMVTAGAPDVPEPLLDQLAEGGRLLIPVGSRMSQELVKITKRDGAFDRENLVGCRFVGLIGEHGWEE